MFVLHVELEHRNIDFQYPTVHVPERKGKLLKNEPTWYVAFNKGYELAFVIDGREVLKAPLEGVSNFKVESGERFYDVPKDSGQVYFIDPKHRPKII